MDNFNNNLVGGLNLESFALLGLVGLKEDVALQMITNTALFTGTDKYKITFIASDFIPNYFTSLEQAGIYKNPQDVVLKNKDTGADILYKVYYLPASAYEEYIRKPYKETSSVIIEKVGYKKTIDNILIQLKKKYLSMYKQDESFLKKISTTVTYNTIFDKMINSFFTSLYFNTTFLKINEKTRTSEEREKDKLERTSETLTIFQDNFANKQFIQLYTINKNITQYIKTYYTNNNNKDWLAEIYDKNYNQPDIIDSIYKNIIDYYKVLTISLNKFLQPRLTINQLKIDNTRFRNEISSKEDVEENIKKINNNKILIAQQVDEMKKFNSSSIPDNVKSIISQIKGDSFIKEYIILNKKSENGIIGDILKQTINSNVQGNTVLLRYLFCLFILQTTVSIQELLITVKDEKNNTEIQVGGSNYYYLKYLKYKQKYLNLKK